MNQQATIFLTTFSTRANNLLPPVPRSLAGEKGYVMEQELDQVIETLIRIRDKFGTLIIHPAPKPYEPLGELELHEHRNANCVAETGLGISRTSKSHYIALAFCNNRA